MTVCVASICQTKRNLDWEVVINAADRMISVGSLVTYEPDQSKIIELTPNESDRALLMIAGATSLQSEIVNTLRQRIRTAKTFPAVKEIAEMYCGIYQEIYFRKATSAVLTPQLLTRKMYESQQRKGVVSDRISQGLSQFHDSYRKKEEGRVEAIVSGIDGNGAQIYQIKNDDYECRTNDGFAAIGVGGWHSESQFMSKGFVDTWGFNRALFMTFMAKKKAEIAEGISKTTDLGFITHKEVTMPISPDAIKRLETAYNELEKEVDDAETKVWEKFKVIEFQHQDAVAESIAKNKNTGS